MEIIIEDNKVDFQLPDREVYLKDIVDEVETFLLSVGKVPTSLSINGQELEQEELEKRLPDRLSGDEELKFGVTRVIEFVADNLQGAIKANAELLKILSTFADEIYSPDKTVKAQDLIVELNQFFQFWHRIHGLVPQEINRFKFDGKTFDVCFEEMTKSLEEVVHAMEAKDFVLAADLLQYEFSPGLEAIQEQLPKIIQELRSPEQA